MAFSDVFYTYTHSFDIVLLLGLVLSDGIHVFHFKIKLILLELSTIDDICILLFGLLGL